MPSAGSSAVSDQIKAYILEHRLQPGDPMPTEVELVQELGASRSSVREAVKTLAALDIVEVRHGYGTYVGSMSMRAMVENLTFRGMLASGSGQQVLTNLVEVRETLEHGMAPAILATLEQEHLDALGALASQMCDQADRGESFVEQDRAFHMQLLEPLGNELVVQLTEALWRVHGQVAPPLRTRAERMRTAEAHVGIVEAVAERDLDGLHRALDAHYAPIRERLTAGERRGRSTRADGRG